MSHELLVETGACVCMNTNIYIYEHLKLKAHGSRLMAHGSWLLPPPHLAERLCARRGGGRAGC